MAREWDGRLAGHLGTGGTGGTPVALSCRQPIFIATLRAAATAMLCPGQDTNRE